MCCICSVKVTCVHILGSSAINSVKDVAIHQLKKKSLYLLNFVQTCINAGFWNEAITSVLERDPFLHRDMEVI